LLEACCILIAQLLNKINSTKTYAPPRNFWQVLCCVQALLLSPHHMKLSDKMTKSKQWLFFSLLSLGLFIAALWGGQRLLYFIGEREIYLAAQENGYCQDETCQDGIRTLVAMLAHETGIDSDLVSWCMAANAISTTQFGTIEGLKEKFADWMYRSCGNDDITIEDAVLSIGEPE